MAKPTPTQPSLLASVPLTFQHNPPGGKKDLAEWNTGVGPRGLVLTVQAEHERLDEGVAIAEGVGEDVRDPRVHRVIVGAVPGQVLLHGLWTQHQGQVVPVSDDLKKSHSEWPLYSALPVELPPAPGLGDLSHPSVARELPPTALDLSLNRMAPRAYAQLLPAV